jgi:alpha-L-arabinofuranosidase
LFVFGNPELFPPPVGFFWFLAKKFRENVSHDFGKVYLDARSLVVRFNSPDYTYNGLKIPAVNVSASRDSLGVEHISLVNLDPAKTITVRTAVENLISKSVTGQMLTSERFTDINTFREPGKVKMGVFDGVKKQGGELVVTLPPKSVVVVEVKWGEAGGGR